MNSQLSLLTDVVHPTLEGLRSAENVSTRTPVLADVDEIAIDGVSERVELCSRAMLIGEVDALAACFTRLPSRSPKGDPLRDALAGWLAFLRGLPDDAEAYFLRATSDVVTELTLERVFVDGVIAQRLVFRGQYEGALALVERARAMAQVDHPMLRAWLHLIRATIAVVHGDMGTASRLMEQVAALATAYRVPNAQTTHSLAWQQMQFGNVSAARALLEHGLHPMRAGAALQRESAAIAHAMLAGIAFDMAQFAEATQHGNQAVTLGQQLHQSQAQMGGFCILARIALRTGKVARALNFATQANAAVRELEGCRAFPEAILAETAWRLGECDAVEQWWERASRGSEATPPAILAYQVVLRARILIAQHRVEEAEQLMTPWVPGAGGRSPSPMSTGVAAQWAAAALARGDRTDATRRLRIAIRIAVPHQLVTPLIEAQPSLLPLVQRLARETDRIEGADFAQHVKRVCQSASMRQQRRMQPNTTLSPREHTILTLLGGGSSNAEIASGLGSAVGTVKKQVSSILRKLDARSRLDVVAVARREGLLT